MSSNELMVGGEMVRISVTTKFAVFFGAIFKFENNDSTHFKHQIHVHGTKSLGPNIFATRQNHNFILGGRTDNSTVCAPTK